MKKFASVEIVAIVANIGVVAGILLLAYELRQNTQSLEAQAAYNHKESRASFAAEIAANRDLAELLVKAENGADLSPVEQLQLRSHFDRMFTTWEWEFFEAKAGRLELPLGGYRDGMARAGALDRWEESEFRYREEFVEWVNSNVVGQSRELPR